MKNWIKFAWIVLAFFSGLPILLTIGYVFNGFDKVNWINGLVELPNHTLWMFIMYNFVASIWFMIYCINRFANAMSDKPKERISKAELHEIIMNGGAN
jgi:hypothetical protein